MKILILSLSLLLSSQLALAIDYTDKEAIDFVKESSANVNTPVKSILTAKEAIDFVKESSANVNTPVKSILTAKEAIDFVMESSANVNTPVKSTLTDKEASARRMENRRVNVRSQDNNSKELTDADKNILLINAIQANKVEEIKRLINQGANPNARDHKGWISLHFAALDGYVGAMTFLVKGWTNVYTQKNLDLAPSSRHQSSPPYIITQEFGITYGADVNAQTDDGKTSLHLSAIRNRVGAMNFLIDSGADINIIDKTGSTPLDSAIYSKSANAIKLLKKLGALTAKELENVRSAHTAQMKILQEQGTLTAKELEHVRLDQMNILQKHGILTTKEFKNVRLDQMKILQEYGTLTAKELENVRSTQTDYPRILQEQGTLTAKELEEAKKLKTSKTKTPKAKQSSCKKTFE